LGIGDVFKGFKWANLDKEQYLLKWLRVLECVERTWV